MRKRELNPTPNGLRDAPPFGITTLLSDAGAVLEMTFLDYFPARTDSSASLHQNIENGNVHVASQHQWETGTPLLLVDIPHLRGVFFLHRFDCRI
jgi:hypothetical protein